MKQLDGRVAVVTGGASGIGLGMARAFARSGMRLVIADLDDGALQAAVAELEAGGSQVMGAAMSRVMSKSKLWRTPRSRSMAPFTCCVTTRGLVSPQRPIR